MTTVYYEEGATIKQRQEMVNTGRRCSNTKDASYGVVRVKRFKGAKTFRMARGCEMKLPKHKHTCTTLALLYRDRLNWPYGRVSELGFEILKRGGAPCLAIFLAGRHSACMIAIGQPLVQVQQGVSEPSFDVLKRGGAPYSAHF
jgi:hypothetical protein